MKKEGAVAPASLPKQELTRGIKNPPHSPAVFTAALIGEILDQELAEVNRIRIEELAAKGRLADQD